MSMVGKFLYGHAANFFVTNGVNPGILTKGV